MPAGRPSRRWGLGTEAGRDSPSDREEGLVIPAVLLTVTVMILGVLNLVSRVAAARNAAASSSLAASARQAAEYGFSQVVAEMNRDGKSYLWVTPIGSWNSVSASDLQNCGIASASPPTTNPIPGVSSAVALPGNGNLSYQLMGYQVPETIGSTCSPFGNRKGGSGILTITGTARRSSSDPNPASYTLRRSVTVGQAVPLFRTSVFRGGSGSSGVNIPASPHFPTPAGLGVTPLATPWPAVSCFRDTATEFRCTSASGANTFTTSPTNLYRFPKDSSTGALAHFCQSTATRIVCMVSSLTLMGNFDLVVDVSTRDVIIFIDSGELNIKSTSNLCSAVNSTSAAADTCSGASGDWRRLRLYGRASAASCDQALTLNRVNLTGGNFRANLHNAFLWFPTATLTYDATTNTFNTLVGSVCQLSPGVPSSTGIQDVTPLVLHDSLAEQKLLFYRGYGAVQQRFVP
jgi:hypothetical protein